MKSYLQNLRKWAVMAVLTIGTITDRAGAVTVPQPVGIPAGKTVHFGPDGSGRVQGFCIHQPGKGGPKDPTKFQVISGQVTLHFRDETSRSMSLASAVAGGWVTVVKFGPGIGGFSTELKAHPTVESLEFTKNAAIGDNTVHLDGMNPGERQAAIDQTFEFYDPKKSAWENKFAIWNAKTGWNLIRDGGGEKVYVPLTYDPARHMSVRFDRLSSQADASIVKSPGGRCLIHDMGGSEQSTIELLKLVEKGSDGTRRVALVLTHADADHFRGLFAAMKSGALAELNVVIDEILIGVPNDISENGVLADGREQSALFREFLGHLLKNGYVEHGAFGRFARFVHRQAQPLAIQLVTPVAGRRSDSPDVFEIKLEDGFGVKIVGPAKRADAAGDRHASNLVSYYEHEGTAVLDMGDAGIDQIKGMIETPVPGYERDLRFLERYEAFLRKLERPEAQSELARIRQSKANVQAKIDAWNAQPFGSGYKYWSIEGVENVRVLKWPHHAWRPTSPAERRVMKAFLRAVRPDQIVISMSSNPSAAAKERLADIRQLVKEAMEEDGQLRIEVLSTGQSAIEFRARYTPGAHGLGAVDPGAG